MGIGYSYYNKNIEINIEHNYVSGQKKDKRDLGSCVNSIAGAAKINTTKKEEKLHNIKVIRYPFCTVVEYKNIN